MVVSLAYVAAYILLVGIASFVEAPVGKRFGPFELNALIRLGGLAAATVAVIVLHGFSLPPPQPAMAGLGIGLLTGVGSIFYCFALKYLRVSLVVTLSNLYLVITTLLGIVILHERVTAIKVAGFAVTLAGVVLLSHTPTRYGISPRAMPEAAAPRVRGMLVMAAYIVMIGLGAFLEKPALKGLDAAELNFLMAIAMMAVAGVALTLDGSVLRASRQTFWAVGIGVMIGVGSIAYFLGLRGLPVSVAAASSNAYIVITVLLSTIFLRQPLTRTKGAAVALTVLGVALLSVSAS